MKGHSIIKEGFARNLPHANDVASQPASRTIGQVDAYDDRPIFDLIGSDETYPPPATGCMTKL